MKKNKVFLVIDNPSRDLQGMIFLANKLAIKGMEVFLVPMYDQWFEILRIRPDIVLLNYVKLANAEFCELCFSLGIRTTVLDTEGGVFDDMYNDFIERIPKDIVKNVDIYFTWGREQKKAIIEQGLLPVEKVIDTGCPRYDLCSEKGKKALALKGNGDKFILVNTRYGLLFPRYAKDIVSEIEKPNRSQIVNIDWCKRTINSMKGCYSILAAVRCISENFPDIKIVVRPHPFEKEEIYKIIFEEMQNVEVVREGFSMEWINSSIAVVQKECSTAIEAMFLGKPAFSIDWAGEECSGAELTYSAAQSIKHKNELIENLRKVIDGTYCFDFFSQERTEKYFGKIDGKASDRVCAEFSTLLLSKKGNKKNKPFGWKNYVLLAIRIFKIMPRLLIGKTLTAWIRGCLGKQSNASKDFSIKEVSGIMENIHTNCEKSPVVKIKKQPFSSVVKIYLEQ